MKTYDLVDGFGITDIPYFTKNGAKVTYKSVIDDANRLQAENESLKSELEKITQLLDTHRDNDESNCDVIELLINLAWS